MEWEIILISTIHYINRSFTNLIAVLLLSKVIADETKKYDGENLNDKDTTEVPILANAKKGVLG